MMGCTQFGFRMTVRRKIHRCVFLYMNNRLYRGVLTSNRDKATNTHHSRTWRRKICMLCHIYYIRYIWYSTGWWGVGIVSFCKSTIYIYIYMVNMAAGVGQLHSSYSMLSTTQWRHHGLERSRGVRERERYVATPGSTKVCSALLLIHQRLLRWVVLLVQRQIGHTAGCCLGGVLTLSLMASLASTQASNGNGRSRR